MYWSQSVIDLKYFLLAPAVDLYFLGKAGRFRTVDTFCSFVGHGRSGGTLVGSLLNAHPNIVISNEFHAVRLIRKNMPASTMIKLIYVTSGRQVQRGSLGGGGYAYAVENQWQGKHRELRVIGTRKAGETAMEISRFPDVLRRFAQRVPYQKKFIHVSRNPFDCIATTFRKTKRYQGEKAGDHLRREIDRYFVRCESVETVRRKFGNQNVEICYLEQLSADPSLVLTKLCSFLGVPASAQYLADCAQIVNPRPNESRWTIDWDDESKNMVLQNMSRFAWFQYYHS